MSFDLIRRPRRLRNGAGIRALVRETVLRKDDLVMPIFVTALNGGKREISSMPGIYQLGFDALPEELDAIMASGVRSVLIFGIPHEKDDLGSDTWHDHGVVQKAVRLIKANYPELYVITDVCFCEYTTHGHCGVVSKTGELLNDSTLENLQKQAVSHAEAGADMVAPSGMIDGMIGAMRTALDDAGFENLPIMSYAVKYSSSFYGPFREAVDSAPQFGDRRAYQMDPANRREALVEAELDLNEGADILMVKPALSYLDVISDLKANFDVPIACYNVSGEYSMVKAAAEKGWIDEAAVRREMLLSMKRAGADIIITYFARDIAPELD